MLTVLSDGQPHSTRQIVREARVMAVSAAVAELRTHGATITCERAHDHRGLRFEYTMTKAPDDA
ncbi:hypothetical protein ACXN5S_12400 [Pseudoroseicyclus sp. H15]